MDTSNFKEVFESPKVKALTTQVAALELEVVRLREALKHIKYETDIHGNNLNRGIKDEAVKALSTPFTPTALPELIEKAERLTIERCAEKLLSIGALGDGDFLAAIRAIPNVTLEELL